MLDPRLPENAQKFVIIEQLQQVADQAGMTLAHLAVAFARSHPAVKSIIVGPRTSEQLSQYLTGADLVLNPDLLDTIDAIVPPGEESKIKIQDLKLIWFGSK
ncbi:aldo/keto reductase [Paenibacillus polymyxa]|uniref:aldo/keto reductase n=1 Tax=Paenibacillus polymyxa TaxID=1406 RepID=UPI002AB470F0|nr:aldo/keto reductase [Paenibacillus polymyxa]MDY8026249.1 aldo/keto reductase [Paenibacillus polymyxa]